ncbi:MULTISPECIES: peptidoglycan D,D-transpeptidase FtsI family protein [unclassified Sphingobium]|uniref:peptidoglycan D,D-transpeptidase FtsI family protein n=1 Tax=unclassified Sphingobium TaxID=2611147 RepID=UPI002224365F|nr:MULTISPECIES: penicillin-binding protein 2 [unclassified Sphingobium]MCW2365464.1 cell division protein FtsI (penicillin-binding protein 3) [Sphingobium sp. B7D2B]MCW2380959.1 cell division protein FtsI (penicillin-binding protein 3) [Sphingobium sp. B2D3B]MCW2398935.1 cell division protein FtsI (penicillin-binding protein 3) [Sphingobium sp. B2D3C]
MATILARPEPRSENRKPTDLVTVAHGRIMLLLLIFAAITMVMAAKMVWMGIDAGTQAERMASPIPIPGRADIVDRNGVPLARDIDGYAIAVRRDRLLGDPRDLAKKLHAIFPDQSEADFYAKLTSGGQWNYLRTRAVPRDVAAVNALGEIGIEFPREAERLYPQRTLAAHLIGFVNRDGFGAMGVERAFDDRLTDEKTRGQPLQLSIDSRVQAALEEELSLGMAEQSAKGAVGIVLDSRNGEVIAMASLPTFNPNRLVPVEAPMVMGPDGQMRRGQITCDMSPRCNRVVQARYELGSTFKPLSFAIAMDAGVIVSMSKRYDATAPLPVGRFTIKDDHPLGRWLTVPEALVHSSNIVTARIADEMGQKPLEAAYRSLEFDRPATVELREQAGTLFPSRWYRTTIMTTAYGHGIAVTPMHLASAYAALVNGGIWHPTTVLKRKPNEQVAARRVFSEQTSAKMRQLLRMIVQTGTGRNADAEGYRVGGKTGTAEKPKDGGYARRSLVSTFAAAFPMEAPRYVVIVMMDEPQGSARYPGIRTAAYTAAPVVKSFVSRAAPLLGVYPEAFRDVDISELTPLVKDEEVAE